MGNYRNFTLVAYFVAHAAARVTREELERQLTFMERYLRLDKIYLEPFRGELASHEQVEMCRKVFEKHGIEVAGGLTTVIPTPRPRTRPWRASLVSGLSTGRTAAKAAPATQASPPPPGTG